MHFSHRNARNLGPRLVCVCVVIQKLVTEHKCHGEQTVLAARLSLDTRIELLQTVDEQESEDDDILCHLCRRKNGRHPLAEACCGDRLGYQ